MDSKISDKWNKIKDLRMSVNNEIEEKRKAGKIGSSLEAKIKLEVNEMFFKFLQKFDLNEIFICSDVSLLLNPKLIDYEVNVFAEKASGMKCERCWKFLKEVNEKTRLCLRCEKVLEKKID